MTVPKILEWKHDSAKNIRMETYDRAKNIRMEYMTCFYMEVV